MQINKIKEKTQVYVHLTRLSNFGKDAKTYVYMYTYINIYVYIYMYMCMHTHTHIYIS